MFFFSRIFHSKIWGFGVKYKTVLCLKNTYCVNLKIWHPSQKNILIFLKKIKFQKCHFSGILQTPKPKKPQTVQDDMTERLRVMREACQAHGLHLPGNDSVHQPYPWEYLINEEHNLVWCNIFKCGSTRLVFTTIVPETLALNRCPKTWTKLN
jgi:hypothetical protein